MDGIVGTDARRTGSGNGGNGRAGMDSTQGTRRRTGAGGAIARLGTSRPLRSAQAPTMTRDVPTGPTTVPRGGHTDRAVGLHRLAPAPATIPNGGNRRRTTTKTTQHLRRRRKAASRAALVTVGLGGLNHPGLAPGNTLDLGTRHRLHGPMTAPRQNVAHRRPPLPDKLPDEHPLLNPDIPSDIVLVLRAEVLRPKSLNYG